jgi:FMN-dependent NADH-azoreductase
MTAILQLDSSATGEASVTNGLNALLVEVIGTDATVVHRDLTTLPALSNELLVANNTPATDRTPGQNELATLADSIIAEAEAADVIVIGAPIYNFGVPGAVKAWMDLIARAGRTFSYSETGPVGHLTGKKAYIVSASGGVALGSEADFATPHLTLFLGFLGITDITVIDAGGLMADADKVQKAQDQIRQLAAV